MNAFPLFDDGRVVVLVPVVILLLFEFWFSFVCLLCLSEKAWGIAGPPVLSAIGRAGGQNPD
jgi:hypothetical protein